jgi:hypothetical protein
LYAFVKLDLGLFKIRILGKNTFFLVLRLELRASRQALYHSSHSHSSRALKLTQYILLKFLRIQTQVDLILESYYTALF